MFLVQLCFYTLITVAAFSDIIATENIKHENIDNKVEKVGNEYRLAVKSALYDFEYKLILKKEDDPLIFSQEDENLFVINHPSSVNRAFGSIIDGRFFGQFRTRDTTFYIDHPEKVGKAGRAILYSLEDVIDDGPKEGKFLTAAYDSNAPQPLISRQKTTGNICRMRIIVDKYLLRTFGNDKGRVRAMVKEHETSLNDIYKTNNVKIRGKAFQFKVVEIEFHDEQYCSNNRNSVGCNAWNKGEDDKFLEEHAKRDHSDVCLSFLFTSHDFGSTLGVAYIGTVCSSHRPTITSNGQTSLLSANTGFITFDGKTFVPTSHLTFAHEVGHNMGSGHDGSGPSQGCPLKGYLMASFAPNRPTEENKRLSSCSLSSMDKAIAKLINDRRRQCMVEKDKVTKPKPTERPTSTNVNIDINNIPSDNPEEELDKAASSTSALYIVSGVVVVLIIVIAFLLFCLCSKRDLSPCPNRSDFGRRYTQVRKNVRQSVRYLSRQVTLTKNREDHQKLDNHDSQPNTPEFGRTFPPSRQAPILPKDSSYVYVDQIDNPIMKPVPYTTPSSQMTPKMKPNRPIVSPNTHQAMGMTKPISPHTVPRFSPKPPQLNINKNARPLTPNSQHIPKLPNSPGGRLNSPFVTPQGVRKFDNQPNPKAIFPYEQSNLNNIPKLPNSPGRRLNSPFGTPQGVRKFDNQPTPKALFTNEQSNVASYKPKVAHQAHKANTSLLPNSPKKFLSPKKLDTRRWDRGQISREEAEDELSGDLVGGFLVRRSGAKMILSLNDVGRVKHIKLEEKNGKITGDNKIFFGDVEELIDHYKKNSIPGTHDVRLR